MSDEKGKFYVDGVEKSEIVRMGHGEERRRCPLADAGLHQAARPRHRPGERRALRELRQQGHDDRQREDGRGARDAADRQGTDFAEFDAGRGLAFSSNRDGTLSIIAEKSPTSFAALPSVATQFGARTMAFDPRTGRIFLVTADMAVNPSAAPADWRHRYTITPGSVKLLFLDPVSK